MRYIHCTQRLLKEINSGIKSYGLERKVNGLGDWYANVFPFENQVCLIFMNEKTLYPFIVPEIYRDNIEDFGKTFINGLLKSIEINRLSNKIVDNILKEYSLIEIVKTKNPSKVASMNDHMNFFNSCFESNLINFKSIEDFNKNIVKKPLGALNFRTPLEMLVELIKNEFEN